MPSTPAADPIAYVGPAPQRPCHEYSTDAETQIGLVESQRPADQIQAVLPNRLALHPRMAAAPPSTPAPAPNARFHPLTAVLRAQNQADGTQHPPAMRKSAHCNAPAKASVHAPLTAGAVATRKAAATATAGPPRHCQSNLVQLPHTAPRILPAQIPQGPPQDPDNSSARSTPAFLIPAVSLRHPEILLRSSGQPPDEFPDALLSSAE